MAVEYELILIGTVGGLIRNLIGYIKAKLKHKEGFSLGKFAAAVTWGSIVGGVLMYLEHGYARSFAPIEVVLIAVAGTVIIDEILQAVFLRSRSGGAE